MTDMHARALALAQHDALAAQQAAAELRQAEAARKARGRWARLRAGGRKAMPAADTLGWAPPPYAQFFQLPALLIL